MSGWGSKLSKAVERKDKAYVSTKSPTYRSVKLLTK